MSFTMNYKALSALVCTTTIAMTSADIVITMCSLHLVLSVIVISLKYSYSYMNDKIILNIYGLVIWVFFKIVALCYIPFLIFRFFKRPKTCPPVANPILLLRASELAEKVRKRELLSEVVVKAYISRIYEVNPILNAMIEERFVEALEEARKVDTLVASGELTTEELQERYPLLGVPLTVKGSIAVTGLSHTGGRPDHSIRAFEDADTVKHVRNAGAIPILTSNVPELCLNWETSNKLIGTTRNPYNSTRTVGGSSGGECSLMGAGASLIGLGSDVAGSLRLPAHFCGVYGHKPSPMAVSCEGHYPDCHDRDDWYRMFTLGPLARYATDLRTLMNVITEPPMKEVLRLDEKVDIGNIRMYYIEEPKSWRSDRVNGDTLAAIQGVVAHFDTLCNVKCTKADIPLMKFAGPLSFVRLLSIQGVENLFEDNGKGVYWEMLKFFTGCSNHEFSAVHYTFLRRNWWWIVPKKFKRLVYEKIAELKNDVIKLLGRDGVLIFPSYPSEAPHHNDIFRKVFNNGLVSIFSSLELPVTCCPVSMSKSGLPIGLQVVAGPNNDRLTLTVAEELERRFGGWKAPNTHITKL